MLMVSFSVQLTVLTPCVLGEADASTESATVQPAGKGQPANKKTISR